MTSFYLPRFGLIKPYTKNVCPRLGQILGPVECYLFPDKLQFVVFRVRFFPGRLLVVLLGAGITGAGFDSLELRSFGEELLLRRGCVLNAVELAEYFLGYSFPFSSVVKGPFHYVRCSAARM